MTTIDYTEYPVTMPVPVVQTLPAVVDTVPGLIGNHFSSTMQLAPVGISRVGQRIRRWQLDDIERKLVKRAQVQADSSYRIAKSWGAIDLDQIDIEDLDDAELARVLDLINLIKKAWAEFNRDQAFATEMRKKHISRRRRRAGVIVLLSSAAASAISWQLATAPIQGIGEIAGVGLVGSYIFGQVGRGAHRRTRGPVRRRTDGAAPAPEKPTFEFPIQPHEDPLQLLRDIEATRRMGETAIWTSLLVRRLKEECGTRYSTLYPKDLREMLKDFATDPSGTPLEEGKARMTVTDELLEHMGHYHPTVDAEVGDSKPLAGYHYDNQIKAAITLAESTNTESEFQS